MVTLSWNKHKNPHIGVTWYITPKTPLYYIGAQLPYLGCIEAEINVPDGLDKADSVHCLFLVALDTKYSTRTPIIIGTNISGIFLENCKATCGTGFLQTAKLHSPWYTSFRTIVAREKNLQRNKSTLAVVRCAVLEKMLLKPNETRNIKAKLTSVWSTQIQ